MAKTSKTLECGHSGKPARENPVICTVCWDEAGFENEHSDTDGRHDTFGTTEPRFESRCPICRDNQPKVVGHGPVDGFRGRCACGVFCHTFGTGDNRKLAIHISREATKAEAYDADAARARVAAKTEKAIAKTGPIVVKTRKATKLAPKRDEKQEAAFEDLKSKSPARRKSRNVTAPGSPGQPTSLYPSERPRSTHKRKAVYDVFGEESLGF